MVARIATLLVLANAAPVWAGTTDACKLSQAVSLESLVEVAEPDCGDSCHSAIKPGDCVGRDISCARDRHDLAEDPRQVPAGPRCLEAGPSCGPLAPMTNTNAAITLLTYGSTDDDLQRPTYGWTTADGPMHQPFWLNDRQTPPPTRPPIV